MWSRKEKQIFRGHTANEHASRPEHGPLLPSTLPAHTEARPPPQAQFCSRGKWLPPDLLLRCPTPEAVSERAASYQKLGLTFVQNSKRKSVYLKVLKIGEQKDLIQKRPCKVKPAGGNTMKLIPTHVDQETKGPRGSQRMTRLSSGGITTRMVKEPFALKE